MFWLLHLWQLLYSITIYFFFFSKIQYHSIWYTTIKLCLPILNELTDKQFTLSFLSVKMWQIISVTLLVALLLNSIYPAILLSSFEPLNVFRGITVLAIKDTYLRKGLVVLQFTISVILIASTFIIYRQMVFIQQSDPGYNRSQVLSFALPFSMRREKRVDLMETFKQELLAQSSIESVIAVNQPLVNLGSMCTECADWEGRNPTFNPQLAQLSTDDDFFKTMQPQMLEGRWFQKDRTTDKHNFILNETAIKELNIKKPIIGQPFIFKGDTGQIVGVVKDFNYKSLHEKIGPLVIFNNNLWHSYLMVRIAPKNTAAGLAAIENIWKKHLEDTPIEYHFLDDSFNELYKADQQTANLILGFAVIAVFISALGLFGLAMFTAERRTKEIGIRKVLGASISSIITLLSTEFVRLVIIASILAFPIAWWAIALLTVSFQAIRAAVANPVESLRSE